MKSGSMFNGNFNTTRNTPVYDNSQQQFFNNNNSKQQNPMFNSLCKQNCQQSTDRSEINNNNINNINKAVNLNQNYRLDKDNCYSIEEESNKLRKIQDKNEELMHTLNKMLNQKSQRQEQTNNQNNKNNSNKKINNIQKILKSQRFDTKEDEESILDDSLEIQQQYQELNEKKNYFNKMYNQNKQNSPRINKTHKKSASNIVPLQNFQSTKKKELFKQQDLNQNSQQKKKMNLQQSQNQNSSQKKLSKILDFSKNKSQRNSSAKKYVFEKENNNNSNKNKNNNNSNSKNNNNSNSKNNIKKLVINKLNFNDENTTNVSILNINNEGITSNREGFKSDEENNFNFTFRESNENDDNIKNNKNNNFLQNQSAVDNQKQINPLKIKRYSSQTHCDEKVIQKLAPFEISQNDKTCLQKESNINNNNKISSPFFKNNNENQQQQQENFNQGNSLLNKENSKCIINLNFEISPKKMSFTPISQKNNNINNNFQSLTTKNTNSDKKFSIKKPQSGKIKSNENQNSTQKSNKQSRKSSSSKNEVFLKNNKQSKTAIKHIFQSTIKDIQPQNILKKKISDNRFINQSNNKDLENVMINFQQNNNNNQSQNQKKIKIQNQNKTFGENEVYFKISNKSQKKEQCFKLTKEINSETEFKQQNDLVDSLMTSLQKHKEMLQQHSLKIYESSQFIQQQQIMKKNNYSQNNIQNNNSNMNINNNNINSNNSEIMTTQRYMQNMKSSQLIDNESQINKNNNQNYFNSNNNNSNSNTMFQTQRDNYQIQQKCMHTFGKRQGSSSNQKFPRDVFSVEKKSKKIIV